MPEAEQSPSDHQTDADSTEVHSDADLIAATRDGDTAAYGELYERHVDAARRLARVLAKDSAEADDLVSETFARLLAALRGGRGPDLAFRAYLLTTLRNTFYDRTRRDRKVEFTDDMSKHDPGEAFDDPAIAGQERRYAARAFHRLPERWQVVLWHTEVEGETAADIAPLLGLTPNGVSALAYRARERLRQMYLQEHINESPEANCRWTADRLGARVRGGLATRDSSKVDEHLRGCSACTLLLLELTEVNSGMREVLAFLIVGFSAPAYLGATAAKGAVVAGWFGGVVVWVSDLGRQGVNWIRRIAQRIGGRTAATAGVATAVLAAILALVMVANSPAPEPDTYANPPAEQPDEPATEPGNDPADPPPPPDDPAEPADPDDPEEPEDPEEPDEPAPEPDDDYTIIADPSIASLVAGTDGTLPIELTAPGPAGRAPVAGRVPATESAALSAENDALAHSPARTPARSEQLRLELRLPEAVSSIGGDAGDGWQCEPGSGLVVCVRTPLDPGQTTVAHVPLTIPVEVTGFHDITAAVSGPLISGEATLRVPVAPSGMTTAYSTTEATGLATAGNTLLTCAPKKLCRHPLADNHMAFMEPYRSSEAPDAFGKKQAASGATLSIPGGARILWAGLYWTGSTSAPSSVSLLTPGGGRHDLNASRNWSGYTGSAHQSATDITGLITGSGEYWLGTDRDALPTGLFQYAGWSITVVYEEPGAAGKETAVYEGLAQPPFGGNLSVDVPYGGDVQVAYTLWDGSRTLRGDEMTIGGTPVGDGNLGRSHSPSAIEGGDWHTFGVDVADCRVQTGPDPAPVVISIGTDQLGIGVLAIAAPPPPT